MDNVALGLGGDTPAPKSPQVGGKTEHCQWGLDQAIVRGRQKWGAVSGMGLARDRFPGTRGKTSSYGPWGM